MRIESASSIQKIDPDDSIVARRPDAADFFDSIGHEETIQDVSGDGSFPRKQPRLPLRYSLNR